MNRDWSLSDNLCNVFESGRCGFTDVALLLVRCCDEGRTAVQIHSELEYLYRVSTKGGTESSNLYLGYQLLQSRDLINLDVINT